MRKNIMVNYKNFRLSKLNTEEFKHLKYFLYWPIYGIFYIGTEQIWIRDYYYPVHCFLDDIIPFHEAFLIPYMLWFVYLIGFIVYGLLYDTDSFKRMMRFMIVTYTTTLIIYLLFPNCQELRPETFARDNILTRFMSFVYRIDTNTNVCPSIHVIGSVAVVVSAWKSRYLSGWGWRIGCILFSALICASTVFLKQHSAVDILAAMPVCVLGYFAAYLDVFRRKSGKIIQKVY
ncbi:MAG: phosphatidic acid phosphatase [Clostridia bacterium]|nr:phosphatidic acid phosphatase [Clostridia bacterium]